MMGPRLLLILLIVALHGVAEGRGIGRRADVDSGVPSEPARLEAWHLRSGVIPGSVERALASGGSRRASSLNGLSGVHPKLQEVERADGCTTGRSRYDCPAHLSWPRLLTAYDTSPPSIDEGPDGRSGLEQAEYDTAPVSSSYRSVLGPSRLGIGLPPPGWSTTGFSTLCTCPTDSRFNLGSGWYEPTDPWGLRRVEVPIDPKSPGAKKAEKIRERYNRAYEVFKKSSPEAAAAAKRLEESEAFCLNVEFDPDPRSRDKAVVTDYRFDAQGYVVEATVKVFPLFGTSANPPADKYPKGAKLTKSAEKDLYTVAHEEQGHFMQTVNDVTLNAEYLGILRKSEWLNRVRELAKESAMRTAGENWYSEYQRILKERGWGVSTEETSGWSDFMEGSADDVGDWFVAAARRAKKAEKRMGLPPLPSPQEQKE